MCAVRIRPRCNEFNNDRTNSAHIGPIIGAERPVKGIAELEITLRQFGQS